MRAVPGPESQRGVSWYDVLGVLPGASAARIQQAYDAKMSLLRPELISGAPSDVLRAASRAQGILGAALWTLGNPVSRERYDVAAGFRRVGEGLARPVAIPSEPGWGPADFGYAGGLRAAELLGSLLALTEWLAPHPRPPGRVGVPDIRGLFHTAGLEVAGRLGIQVRAVRLTEHPRPVDGLIVEQSPVPPATIRRVKPMTVQVWHPPAPA